MNKLLFLIAVAAASSLQPLKVEAETSRKDGVLFSTSVPSESIHFSTFPVNQEKPALHFSTSPVIGTLMKDRQDGTVKKSTSSILNERFEQKPISSW